MKTLKCSLFALVAALSTPTYAGVKVLDRTFSSSEICPGANSSKCIMKSTGATGTYIGSDRRYLNLNGQGEPVLNEYIGHLYTTSLNKGAPFCINRAIDIFSEYSSGQPEPYILKPYEYSFSVKEKVSKLLKVGAQIDLVEIAKTAGVPQASLGQVAAAVSASYEKARDQSVQLNGIFRYYEVNPNVLTSFNASDGAASLQQCKQWLKANNHQVIVGLTGYKLIDAVATKDLTSKFNTELKAKLGNTITEDQIVSLTGKFSSEVERSVKGKFSPNFELLTVAVTS